MKQLMRIIRILTDTTMEDFGRQYSSSPVAEIFAHLPGTGVLFATVSTMPPVAAAADDDPDEVVSSRASKLRSIKPNQEQQQQQQVDLIAPLMAPVYIRRLGHRRLVETNGA